MLLLVCLVTSQGWAQVQEKVRNTISAQMNWSGAGVLLNYERLVWQQGKHAVCVSGGAFGYRKVIGKGGPYPSYPRWNWDFRAGANYQRGLRHHRLEVGIDYFFVKHYGPSGSRAWGFTPDPPTYYPIHDLLVVNERQNHFLRTRIGYRYQKASGGFVFKAGITPFTAILSPDTRSYLPGVMSEYTIKWGTDWATSGSPPRLLFFPVPDLSVGWSF